MNNALQCHRLAYATGGIMLLTIHACMIVSAWQGHVDACNPYWADCVSISRSGRHGLAYFIFKAGMLPAALLLALFWQLNAHWLKTLPAGGRQQHLTAIGWIAAIALLAYTLSLGHSGDAFYLTRRFGVVTFLGLSLIGFALLARALKQSALRQQGKWLERSCAGILSIALFSLALDALLAERYDRLENAFEWWLVLLLILQLCWVARLWQNTAFGLSPRVSASGTANSHL